MAGARGCWEIPRLWGLTRCQGLGREEWRERPEKEPKGERETQENTESPGAGRGGEWRGNEEGRRERRRGVEEAESLPQDVEVRAPCLRRG